MYYSGKKKSHTTVKNQLTVNKDGYILHKIGYKKGRKHDYDVYKKNHPIIPKQVVNVIDLGYLGVEKDFPEQLSSHCRIKRRETNKSYLRKKKSITNFILKKEDCDREHTICRLKKYRIMNDVFRNRLRKYNRISDIV